MTFCDSGFVSLGYFGHSGVLIFDFSQFFSSKTLTWRDDCVIRFSGNLKQFYNCLESFFGLEELKQGRGRTVENFLRHWPFETYRTICCVCFSSFFSLSFSPPVLRCSLGQFCPFVHFLFSYARARRKKIRKVSAKCFGSIPITSFFLLYSPFLSAPSYSTAQWSVYTSTVQSLLISAQ